MSLEIQDSTNQQNREEEGARTPIPRLTLLGSKPAGIRVRPCLPPPIYTGPALSLFWGLYATWSLEPGGDTPLKAHPLLKSSSPSCPHS